MPTTNIPPELKPEVDCAVRVIKEMNKHHALAHLFKLSPDTRRQVCETFLKHLKKNFKLPEPPPTLPRTSYFNAIHAYWLGEYSPQIPVRESLTGILEHLLPLSSEEQARQIETFCNEIDKYLFEKTEASLLNRAINNVLKLPETSQVQVVKEFHRRVKITTVHAKSQEKSVSESHLTKLTKLLKTQYPELKPELLERLIETIRLLLTLPWGIQLKQIVYFQNLSEQVLITVTKSITEAKKKEGSKNFKDKLKRLQLHAKIDSNSAHKKNDSRNLDPKEVKMIRKSLSYKNMPLDVFFDNHLMSNAFIPEIVAHAVNLLGSKSYFKHVFELKMLNDMFKRNASGSEVKYFSLSSQEAEIINEIHNRHGSIFRGIANALDQVGKTYPKAFRKEGAQLGMLVLGMKLVTAMDASSKRHYNVKPV